MQWLVLGVVLLTLGAIVVRPSVLGEAWAAAGALAVLLLGAVTPADPQGVRDPHRADGG